MTPHALIAFCLLAATTIVMVSLVATRPARGQSDKWVQTVAAKPDAKRVRKAPRFYYKKRKTKTTQQDTRRARSRVPMRSEPRAAVVSQLPESREPQSFNETFNEAARDLPLTILVVRTVYEPPPYTGAFHVIEDPALVWRAPDTKPWQEASEFKGMAAGAFCAVLVATIFYGATGGKRWLTRA